jgi:hypothetical protein
MKQPANLARAAMANNQNKSVFPTLSIERELTSMPASPQMAMQMQQAKQAQMQRDPSSMDGSQNRPTSPSSGENAPSPSKRQRVDNAPFNPNQPGAMMPNGRPGMPPQQMPGAPNAAAAQQMLANGLNPGQMQQFQSFVNSPLMLTGCFMSLTLSVSSNIMVTKWVINKCRMLAVHKVKAPRPLCMGPTVQHSTTTIIRPGARWAALTVSVQGPLAKPPAVVIMRYRTTRCS